MRKKPNRLVARYRNYKASWNKASKERRKRLDALTHEHEELGMSREVYQAELAELREEFAYLEIRKPASNE